jgi:hypothetical protein
MSWFVSGSNPNNPFASLQSFWQQQLSTSSTQAPSDPLSALLSELNQQGAGGAGGSSNPSTATATQPTSSPQFGPQTLQALLALQSNGTSAQSLASAIDGGGDDDPLSALGSQPMQSSHGHHRPNHAVDGAGGSNASSGAASGGPDADTGSGSPTGNNLAQLLQMQAQLVAPVGAQSTVMA